MAYSSTDVGPAFTAGVGLRVHFTNLGVALGYEYTAAWAVKDLIGNTHAAGGNRVVLGLTWGF
jgi:hypothetical protein